MCLCFYKSNMIRQTKCWNWFVIEQNFNAISMFFLPFQSLCLNVWIIWIAFKCSNGFYSNLFSSSGWLFYFLVICSKSSKSSKIKQNQRNQMNYEEIMELLGNRRENWALISSFWLIHQFRLVQLRVWRNQAKRRFLMFILYFFFGVLMNGSALMKIKLLLTGWDGLWTIQWYFMVQDFKTFN